MHPCQLERTAPPDGAAVAVTTVPILNFWLQDPLVEAVPELALIVQLMPPRFDVTNPPAVLLPEPICSVYLVLFAALSRMSGAVALSA